jgi:hypothetical protein
VAADVGAGEIDMKRLGLIAACLLVAQSGHAREATAREMFQTISKRLVPLVQNAHTNAVIKQTETSIEITFDTMVYTVHGGSKTGNFSPTTHEEIGPRVQGFVISVSLAPVNPIAAESGQTMQRPYWQEYFWAGHQDRKEYIHFIFKFGRGVVEQFRGNIIRAVAETPQQ